MTTKEQSLERLIERVKAATGPDEVLDLDISLHFRGLRNVGGYWAEDIETGKRVKINYACEPVTASIDAAIALVERVLPGWHIAMGTVGETDAPWACLTEPEGSCRDFPASGIDIPNALLLVLFSSLKETSHDHE